MLHNFDGEISPKFRKLKKSWDSNRMEFTNIGGVEGRWTEQGQETCVSGVDSLCPWSRVLPNKLRVLS